MRCECQEISSGRMDAILCVRVSVCARVCVKGEGNTKGYQDHIWGEFSAEWVCVCEREKDRKKEDLSSGNSWV